jgi:hypothetical protein
MALALADASKQHWPFGRRRRAAFSATRLWLRVWLFVMYAQCLSWFWLRWCSESSSQLTQRTPFAARDIGPLLSQRFTMVIPATPNSYPGLVIR